MTTEYDTTTAPESEPTGECDWGNCDYRAKFWRWSFETGWLPVCFAHSERGEKFYEDLNTAYRNTKGASA